MATLMKHRPGPDGHVELGRQTIGNAIVVHRAGSMTSEARQLALSVAQDDEHDLVVVDLPAGLPVSVWESVAGVLPRRRRGVRLVIGGRSREATALAGQLIAERLGRTVIAPDGAVTLGAGGSLFVHSGRDTGWVRFESGRAPKWEAKRFPRPVWDSQLVSEAEPTSSRGMVEPLPGGVWIRPTGFDRQQAPQRHTLVAQLPLQLDVFTIVLGSPGTSALSLDDVARVWVRLPEEVRRVTRFVRYGQVSTKVGTAAGQALADLLGSDVAVYAGLPVGNGRTPVVRSILPDGRLGWATFAQQLAYRATEPSATPASPAVLAYRAPLPGLHEISPAVYWYSPDAVIEVLQSGLLVRPPKDSAATARARAVAQDPFAPALAFDDSVPAVAARMRHLAQDLAARLEPGVRSAARLLPAGELIAGAHRAPGPARAALDAAPPSAPALLASQPTEVVARPKTDAVAGTLTEAAAPTGMTVESEPPEAATRQIEVPQPQAAPAAAPPMRLESTPAPLVEAPEVTPAPQPEPAAPPATVPATRLQPTPAPNASALLGPHGVDDERTFLRGALGPEYGTMSNSIARVLSEHPGFQGAMTHSSAEVLTDAVAVRLYLSGQGAQVDAGLRTAVVGAHVPVARCVVAGLSRLPSHRGPTLIVASLTERQWELYRSNPVVTEWGFLNTVTGPATGLSGDTDIVVWSMTARRTKLLEPAVDGVDDRVLFVPGTSFKVLECTSPSSDHKGRLLLRELAASEVDESGHVQAGRVQLDDLALASMRGELEKWDGTKPVHTVTTTAAARLSALPGLV